MLAVLLALRLAWAGGVAVPPAGPPAPGQRVVVEVATEGEPAAVGLSARAGEVLSWSGESGRYIVDYRAPATGSADQLLLDLGGRTLALDLALRAVPPSALRLPQALTAPAGPGTQVRIRVEGPDLPPPEELAVAVSEGKVLAIEPVAGALELVFQPAELRDPRAVVVGVRDARVPAEPPTWTTLRLSSRAPIDVRTDPGTRLSVSVGGRSYGPAVARADGRASVTIEVRPGESSAEATLEDSLGNRQSTTIALVRDARPAMVILPEGPLVPGVRAPSLFVRAVDEAGKSWAGPPPQCVSAGGTRLDLWALDAGTWQGLLPPDLPPVGDLLVECTLGEGLIRAAARVPVVHDRGSRLTLQVWPEELTGDLPVASVRASLENARGERLPPDGLVLSADRGLLVATREEELAIYAEYHGDPRVSEDTIRAAWTPPAGGGAPWSLELRLTGAGAEALLLDRSGRPLPDQPVRLSVGAARSEARTDAAGVARFPGPTPPGGVVGVEAGGLTQRRVAPASPDDPPFSAIYAERDVKVRSGRVQRVELRIDPRQVYPGQTARLHLRLEDVSGAPVTDEPVSFEVPAGALGPLELQADGSFAASYVPPGGVVSEDVELLVRSDTGAFPATTTLLELRPRPLNWAPGVSLGAISSLGRPIGPYGELRVDFAIPKLERGILYARVAVGYTRHTDEIPDVSRGQTVDLRMELVPVSANALARRELGLWSIWAGGGVVLTPYHLNASVEGSTVVSGPGLHRPGASVLAGGARRVGNGELTGELTGLSIIANAESVGYEGQVGGVAILLGYRVVY